MFYNYNNSMPTSNIILNKKNSGGKSTRKNEMILNLPMPYKSVEGETVALNSLFIYYSWRNILSKLGNNTFSYIFNGNTFNITIPDGLYTLSDINGFIQFTMENNGHYLLDADAGKVFFMEIVVNTVVYGFTITFTEILTVLPSGWTNPNSITLSGTTPSLVVGTEFGKLIGFTAGTYPSVNTDTVSVSSDLIPVIHPTTSVNVLCSWVNDSWFSQFESLIASFTSNTTFGSLITYVPINRNNYPITPNNWSTLKITLTDQNGEPLDVQDDDIIVNLVVERKN